MKNNTPPARPYKLARLKNPVASRGKMFFGLGAIHPGFIPEIKLSFSKGKKDFGRVTSSVHSATFARKLYGRGQIEVQEICLVLFLNAQNQVIGYHRHTVGGITQSLVDLRLVFADALCSLSTSIILVHNHPSGNANPSSSDVITTSRARKVGELLYIRVLDHLILTSDSYYSFADHNR